MRPMKILIALCLIRKSLQMLELSEENTPLTNRLLCVNTALKTYLKDHRKICILSSNSNSLLVNSLLKVPLILITEWDLLREGLFVDTGPVLIFLEGNADLDFESLNRSQNVVMLGPVIVVCITDVICSSEMYLKKIVETVMVTELHYVALDERGTISIYKHTSMAEGNCGMAQLSRLGSCSDSPTAKKIFQTSLNFHECPLHVVTWHCPPYSEICNFNGSSAELYGIAGSVVTIVTEKVNATPVLMRVQSPEDVRRHVANRDADLGYGELDTRQTFEGISYTKPYMFVQATVVAPHSTWALTRSFGNILQPLGDKVWMGIGVVIVAIFILRRLVPYFRTIFTLQLFGIFLGIPVPTQPRKIHSRIYFFSLVLFGYFCSQSYLTNLTKVLTTPQQQMIRTLDDLEHSKLRVTGPPGSRIMFEADYPRIYRDYQADDDADYYPNLYKLLQGLSDSVYYVEDLDRNIAEWKNVEAIHDRFNWYPIALVVPNTSAVLRTSDEILMRIWESGILYADITFTTTTYQLPKYLAPTSSGKSSELGFNELKGVFLVLISGLGLSLVVFLIEIVAAFIKRKPQLEGESASQTELLFRQVRVPAGILIPRYASRMR